MLLETLVWECVSRSCCGSRRLLPRGRSSPTTCCITELTSMKAAGKINKRAQRKGLFYSEKDLARCWQYYRIFPAPSSSSYSPPPPLLHPRLPLSHQTEAATSKVSRRQLWFVVMATQFSLSPALTWEVVKNVDGFHQRSVEKGPWCWKSGSSERLLNPDVSYRFLHHHHHPVAGLFFCFFLTSSLCRTHSDAHWQQVLPFSSH